MTIPTKDEILNFSPVNKAEKEDLPNYRRKAFVDIEKSLKTGLIVAITGLRRVGKTTIAKQVAPHAYYFSFDEKRYANPDALKHVIEVFIAEKEKPLIILDEVFRVEDWSGVIKKYYDQKKAEFIVTGSLSLTIKKSLESLSGRIKEQYLPPLSFEEFLQLSGKSPKVLALGDFAQTRYESELYDFMKKGSFPQILHMEDKDATDYIRTSTIDRIIFEDIPSIFRIDYPSKLHDLFRLCSTNSSHLFTESNFSEALGMSRTAVSDYLLYLENAYLVDVIYPQGSFQKALKKQKKIFVKSASIYNATSESPNIGQAAETAVYDKLCSQKLEFYRDPQAREIDFIQKYSFEVKFQSSITSDDTKTLRYFLEKSKQDVGYLITKNLFDEREIDGKKIVFVPLDVFLLSKIKV